MAFESIPERREDKVVKLRLLPRADVIPERPQKLSPFEGAEVGEVLAAVDFYVKNKRRTLTDVVSRRVSQVIGRKTDEEMFLECLSNALTKISEETDCTVQVRRGPHTGICLRESLSSFQTEEGLRALADLFYQKSVGNVLLLFTKDLQPDTAAAAPLYCLLHIVNNGAEGWSFNLESLADRRVETITINPHDAQSVENASSLVPCFVFSLNDTDDGDYDDYDDDDDPPQLLKAA